MADDRSHIRALHRAPEQEVLRSLMDAARLPPLAAERVQLCARDLVRQARAGHRPGADVSDFLREYRLNTREGVALLCLAEALLRIPDTKTADALTDSLVGTADWHDHPAGTTIKTLVKVEGHRWAIEDSFETAKNELGLDHNEIRSWHGWHRHVSLVMLAFAMLDAIRHHANASPANAALPPKTKRRVPSSRRR